MVDLILKYTGANPDLVNYANKNEILTTKDKFVDASRALRDLDHKSTVSLEEGVKRTYNYFKENN